MLQTTPFLLVLSLALVAPCFSAEQCVLTGEWVNDLGSTMAIGPVDEQGKFDGLYLTAVTNTPGNVRLSPLVGYQHKMNTCSQPTFGFTVDWNFSDSVTVFTGQCFVDETGKEVLKTMWLLRSRMDNIKDDWKATKVGTNTFTRRQGGIAGGCKAHRSTCNADHNCCHTTGF